MNERAIVALMKRLPALVLGGLLLLRLPADAQVLISRTSDGDRPGIDVEEYIVRATLDPVENAITASASIRFTQLDRQTYAVFELDRRLRVRDVYLGEAQPVAVRFRQFDVDSTLEVDLSALGQFDDPFIRVEYDGVLDPEPDRREPILSRISEDGAFLLEEGRWFPINGVGRDAARMRLEIAAPADWRIVTSLAETAPGPGPAAGEAGGADEAAEAPRPAPRAFASSAPGFWGTVTAGRYQPIAAPAGGGAVEALVLARDADAAPAIRESAEEMFAFYRERFGPSSSRALKLVAVDGANWEARSAPGLLLLAAGEFRADFDPLILAQHIAAQWFPLTYAVDDPVADAWLAQGLAVFASLYYFDETLPALDAREHVERVMVKALSYEGDVTLGEAGRLPRESPEYEALAAYKGGFVFRMLGDVMGQEAFRSMLSKLPSTFAARPVSTSSLFDLASLEGGEDLTYFFDQWLNASGVPEFTRSYVIYRRQDGYEVMGQLRQDLDLFRMPVEIEVLTDGESEFHTVWVTGPTTEMDLATVRKPGTVVIDPNLRLLRFSPELRVRVHVSRGEDLAAQGRFNEAIDEYQRAVDLERLSSLAFFRMGEALFELGNLQAASNVFREALNGDLQPRWIEVWTYINLGKILDIRGQRERAVNEYQKAINTRDDAYGAQAEAERYIAEPFRRSGRTLG